MNDIAEQSVLGFLRYPAIGDDDWRYIFSAAQVRVLESQMLGQSRLVNMAGAENFAQAEETLSGSRYEIPRSSEGVAETESMLKQIRLEARNLCYDLIIDEEISQLFRSRDDFANLRLAIRRIITEKSLGTEYSNEGNVAAEELIEACEQENYELLPGYMQDAVEEAVLQYYQDKDIRRIDYGIDAIQAKHNLGAAVEIGSVFLIELFRMQADLINIRTMLRLKWVESEERDVFVSGGYVDSDRLRHGLDIGYEALTGLFFATPYHHIVEGGVNYLVNKNSFLRLEALCESHLNGFLKTTNQITAGVQPVIAYLLGMEHEIRMVRMILTTKRNRLETDMILARLGESIE